MEGMLKEQILLLFSVFCCREMLVIPFNACLYNLTLSFKSLPLGFELGVLELFMI